MDHDGAADSIHVALGAADASQVVAATVLLELTYSVQVRLGIVRQCGELCNDNCWANRRAASRFAGDEDKR